jgi:hypothetical protein
MVVGVTVGVVVAGLAFLGLLAWFIRSRLIKKEDMIHVSSPVEVKMPGASNGDFKDSPRVVIEDYDKDASYRQGV